MRTLQEKYNGIQEGKFSKEQFLVEARMQQPQLITRFNGYDDAVQILKNRGMVQETIKEAAQPKPTKKGLADYRYKPTNEMDKYPYEQILRGIRVELEAAGVHGTPTPEEYTKALAKVSKNLEKDSIFYTNQVAGVNPKVDLHDKMVPFTEKAAVDTFNGMKKAELKEGFKKLIKKVLSEEKVDVESYKEDDIYEMYGEGTTDSEKGLMVVGRTQVDNNAIGDVLDELELHGEWNAREGYWILPEDEENYDSLEEMLEQEFASRGINARFEGMFNSGDGIDHNDENLSDPLIDGEDDIYEGKKSLSELLK